MTFKLSRIKEAIDALHARSIADVFIEYTPPSDDPRDTDRRALLIFVSAETPPRAVVKLYCDGTMTLRETVERSL